MAADAKQLAEVFAVVVPYREIMKEYKMLGKQRFPKKRRLLRQMQAAIDINTDCNLNTKLSGPMNLMQAAADEESL